MVYLHLKIGFTYQTNLTPFNLDIPKDWKYLLCRVSNNDVSFVGHRTCCI